MRLQGLKGLRDISNKDYSVWKKQAIASGELPSGSSLALQEDLYRRQLLRNLGLNENLSIELANVVAIANLLDSLINSGEVSKDAFTPLAALYQENPTLGASLALKLSDSGYLTNSEISLLSLEDWGSSSKVWTGLTFAPKEFNFDSSKLPDEIKNDFQYDNYDSIRKEKEKEFKNRGVINLKILKEDPEKAKAAIDSATKVEYLRRKNNAILLDIQKEIAAYTESKINDRASEILTSLNINEKSPKDTLGFVKEFTEIVRGVAPGEDGNDTDQFKGGSRYWRGFNRTAFQQFGVDLQKETIAKYNAYKELYGSDRANQWLETEMLSWVADHLSGWQRTDATIVNFTGTALLMLPKLVSEFALTSSLLLGLAVDWYSSQNPDIDISGDAFYDLASILKTGRDTRGRDVSETIFAPAFDPEKSGLGAYIANFFRQGYLENVTKYNDLDPRAHQFAKSNGGIGGNELYVLKPGLEIPNVGSVADLQGAANMAGQLLGQAIELAFFSGGKVAQAAMSASPSLAQLVRDLGRKAILSKEGLQAIKVGFRDAAATAVPIALGYASGVYEQVYNGALEDYTRRAQEDAYRMLQEEIETPEYQKAADKFANSQIVNKGNLEKGATLTYNSPETKEAYKSMYANRRYEEILKGLLDSRSDVAHQLAQTAGLGAYSVSWTGEMLKYGMLNAALQPLNIFKNPNSVIEANVKSGTYGKITLSSTGKFSIENKVPITIDSPIGVGSITLPFKTSSTRVLGISRSANLAIISGGLSNYTDDTTSGLATGWGLHKYNSEYLRLYDPEAYAATWGDPSSFGGVINNYIDGIGKSLVSAAEASMTKQAAYDFYIGALGGLFTPRLQHRQQMRNLYAAENAKYKEETGKDISKGRKFRQGFNTWVTGVIDPYEQARFGVNQTKLNIAHYNNDIGERDKLLTELAEINLTIAEGIIAENQADFTKATLVQDALATKLVHNQWSLEANPLHEMSNQYKRGVLDRLRNIAEGDISDDLITSAHNTAALSRTTPLTEREAIKLRAEIQDLAKRIVDFASDYEESVNELKEQDESFDDPKNAPLLYQTAELQAQLKRLKRDALTLARAIGIQVDFDTLGNQGELKALNKEALEKSTLTSIDRYRELKANLADKLKTLLDKLKQAKEKQDKEEEEKVTKEIILTKANIRGIDRLIASLNRSLEQLNNSLLAKEEWRLTQDAVLLNEMLSHPELYTEELLLEIEAYRKRIGPQGEIYIQELAKLQDVYRNNETSLLNLKDNPQEFISLISDLSRGREAARAEADYQLRLWDSFNKVAALPQNERGIIAAIAYTPLQFNLFKEKHYELTDELNKYSKLNQLLSSLEALIPGDSQDSQGFKLNLMDTINSLVREDADFFVGNESQGLTDMLAFLAFKLTSPTMQDAVLSIMRDYLRTASVLQSTTSYTEYKEKLIAEKAKKLADEFISNLLLAQLQAVESVPQLEATDTTENTSEKIEDKQGTTEEVPTETKEEPIETPIEETPKVEENQLPSEPILAPSAEELPAGVTRISEGNLETMSAEQLAELLGITKVSEESMIDDSAPKILETTELQEEVHGCYFNIYDGPSLRAGELVPFKEGPVYEWLSKEGINLGAIIDNELSNILKVNPKILLMKVKKAGEDSGVASNVFLVVEYTDKVAKHHLPQNGGVITSNGKLYLLIGTMWNTKAQDGTEAANLMLTTRDNLQRKGVDYFDANPSERFYVDPVMNTEVTTFYSGHIVHTVNGESQPKSITELLDEYNRTHTSTDSMSMSDLGFGVITMSAGFYPVGPHSEGKLHSPLRQTVDKYGQVYVLVPAANGEVVPIFINPTVLSEIKESLLKLRIDTVLIPQLLSEDYFLREQAISELCLLLCITGSLTNPEGKGILIGTKDIPTVSLVNGKSVICTFDIKNNTLKFSDSRVNTNPSIKDFIDAVYALNPRINLSLSNLAQPNWLQRYDEAGALTTDSAKLGTFGSKYYVAPINPATGQPIRVLLTARPVEVNSDYTKASSAPQMLLVGGQSYVFRDGRWVHLKDGSPVTDSAELIQVTWAYKVQTGEATLAKRLGNYNYYTIGIETSDPIIVAYNINTRAYEGVPQLIADLIIAERRAEIERTRADKEASKALKDSSSTVSKPSESIVRPADGVIKEAEGVTRTDKKTSGKLTEISKDAATEASEESTQQGEVKAETKKNDFELNRTKQGDKLSIEDMLENFSDETIMDLVDLIYNIIESKIADALAGKLDLAHTEKWLNFDTENMVSELERIGIQATNIDDIESWIDNLKNCE